MRLLGPLFQLLVFLLPHCIANVEKAIFVAQGFEDNHQLLPYLSGLHSLNPHHSTLRTTLSASFPSAPEAKRRESQHWMVLANLEPEQRYEVRICWAAIQPTDFHLRVFGLDEVWTSRELNSSLHEAVKRGRGDARSAATAVVGEYQADDHKTFRGLLLQVVANADYYTLDKSLMQDVPPVNVDIILDPYYLNIFPHSLLPTGAYIVVLALFAWILSDYIWTGLKAISLAGLTEEEATKETTPRPSKKQD